MSYTLAGPGFELPLATIAGWAEAKVALLSLPEDAYPELHSLCRTGRCDSADDLEMELDSVVLEVHGDVKSTVVGMLDSLSSRADDGEVLVSDGTGQDDGQEDYQEGAEWS